MPPKTETAPIIIRRRRGRKHAAHGGAWKVAYADFVTAMMALFIVLWLMGSDSKVKQAVAGYFRDPAGQGSASGSGKAGSGEGMEVQKQDMEHLKEKLENAFRQLPNFRSVLQDKVQMVVTGEGLRIEFMETEQGLFFRTGSATPTAEGTELLTSVAKEVGQMKNDVFIEGHTDSRPFAQGAGYGNWELSADRANAARRILETAGLRNSQVSQVRGYADQHLRDTADPNHASNRRISIVVCFNDAAPSAAGIPAPSRPSTGGHS